MSSTEACECLRRARRKSRVVRPFSRCSRSRSTSRPKRSSNARLAGLGFWSCSSKAAAIPWSFRPRKASRVGLLSIEFSFLVVIAWPAHVLVRRQGEFIGAAHRAPIEAALEDRLDAVPRQRTDRDGPGGGGDPPGAVFLVECQQPEARPIPLLRVRLVGELVGDHRLGTRADGAGPVDEAARAPLGMLQVRLGHVLRDRRVLADLVTALMHGDASRVEEALDSRGAEARLDLMADEVVRNAVVVTIDLDVVIDADARSLPERVLVRGDRQRLHRRTIERLERRTPIGRQSLERALVQFNHERRDRGVELVQAKELPVPQARQHPPGDQEYSLFYFGFVPWVERTRWDDHATVVARELLIRALQDRLVAVGLGDADLRVIGHVDRRRTSKCAHRPNVRAY